VATRLGCPCRRGPRHRPALWGGPWIPAIPAGADEYERQALLDLTRVIEASRLRLASAGLAVETDLLRGAPAFAIPDEAKLWKPDLTVVGSRGHGPVEAALLGSVSSAVVDHAVMPVLVARGDHVRSIVLAEDGSPAGIAARDVVLGWSAFVGIPVRVVGVVDVAAPWRSGIAPTMFSAAMDLYSEMIANSRETYGQVVAATVATLQAAGRTAEGDLREGEPADQLVHAVHDVAGDPDRDRLARPHGGQPDRDGQRRPQRPAPLPLLGARGEAAASSAVAAGLAAEDVQIAAA